MICKKSSNKIRIKRHARMRNYLVGTEVRPRLNVFRSLNNIYAQIIDDSKGITLVAASSRDKDFAASYGGNKEAAREVGKIIAKKAIDKGIKVVVFDRSGYIYHGRIAELAEGAREGGLDF